jgi:hypothetical protein
MALACARVASCSRAELPIASARVEAGAGMKALSKSKRCGACGETKPASDFYLCRGSVDGLQLRCRECQRETNNKPRVRRPFHPSPPTRPGKVCPECGYMKAFEEYHRDRTRPDGRAARCKSCVNANVRGRPSRQERPKVRPSMQRFERPEAEVIKDAERRTEEAIRRIEANTREVLGR